MKTPIVLEAKTNSDQPMPPYAQFDKAQLDTLIAQFSNMVDWSHPLVNSLNTEALPDVYFVSDEHGNDDWDDDDSATKWEQTLTSFTQTGATIMFAHTETGDELFFEYEQAQA